MKQMFEITAFRNIGFKDGKPCASQLVLSNSTEQGKMGELLVLVGGEQLRQKQCAGCAGVLW